MEASAAPWGERAYQGTSPRSGAPHPLPTPLTMAALAAATEPPPGAAERAPTARMKARRGWSIRLCSGPSWGTRYLRAGAVRGARVGVDWGLCWRVLGYHF